MTQILRRPTLVLNRHWQPINVVNAAWALVMVYRGTARAIDTSEFTSHDWDEWCLLTPSTNAASVRTVNRKIQVPEIIALQSYDRTARAPIRFSRRNLFRRDADVCQYCGGRPAASDRTIDHVLPRAQGGRTSWENCVLACPRCNNRKADRTPRQAGMRLRRRPRRPSWQTLYAPEGHGIESWSHFFKRCRN